METDTCEKVLLHTWSVVTPGDFSPVKKPSKAGLGGGTGSGYKALAAAIIFRAKVEAEHGSQEAANWLLSFECEGYCLEVGFEHETIMRWLKSRAIVFTWQK